MPRADRQREGSPGGCPRTAVMDRSTVAGQTPRRAPGVANGQAAAARLATRPVAEPFGTIPVTRPVVWCRHDLPRRCGGKPIRRPGRESISGTTYPSRMDQHRSRRSWTWVAQGSPDEVRAPFCPSTAGRDGTSTRTILSVLRSWRSPPPSPRGRGSNTGARLCAGITSLPNRQLTLRRRSARGRSSCPSWLNPPHRRVVPITERRRGAGTPGVGRRGRGSPPTLAPRVSCAG